MITKEENDLLTQGSLVRRQLEEVLKAVEERDIELADKVISDDDDVDALYLSTEEKILELLDAWPGVFQDPEDQVVMTRVANEVAFGPEGGAAPGTPGQPGGPPGMPGAAPGTGTGPRRGRGP